MGFYEARVSMGTPGGAVTRGQIVEILDGDLDAYQAIIDRKYLVEVPDPRVEQDPTPRRARHAMIATPDVPVEPERKPAGKTTSGGSDSVDPIGIVSTSSTASNLSGYPDTSSTSDDAE